MDKAARAEAAMAEAARAEAAGGRVRINSSSRLPTTSHFDLPVISVALRFHSVIRAVALIPKIGAFAQSMSRLRSCTSWRRRTPEKVSEGRGRREIWRDDAPETPTPHAPLEL